MRKMEGKKDMVRDMEEGREMEGERGGRRAEGAGEQMGQDRKSTRLNSSH